MDRLGELREHLERALRGLAGLDETAGAQRRMRALDEVRQASRLLDEVVIEKIVPLLADEHYLRGRPWRDIAAGMPSTYQGLSGLVMRNPVTYLAVRPDGEGHVLERVVQDRVPAMKNRFGWRVAPAAWRLDPDQVDAAQLWERLADEE